MIEEYIKAEPVRNPSSDTRPIKVVRVTFEIMTDILKGNMGVFKSSLPKDARITGTVKQNTRSVLGQYLDLFISSKEYKLVPFGGIVPEIDIIFTRTASNE